MKPKFYVTTPIYYVNGPPHIGHVYTSIACDVMARFKRLDGFDVFFLTGTDEHGQKVEKAAAEAGLDPQGFTDRISAEFRDAAAAVNISHDDFIRTTETRHKLGCAELWRRMTEAGDIYLGAYEGWYSVRDEAYYGEDELVAASGGGKLAPTGAPVEWVREPSYFFKLSAYQDRLLALYDAQPEFIAPASRRNEVLSFVRGGLRDLSISRSSFRWGIPVPGDPDHVMYVWLDALANYITAVGYPDPEAPRWHYWPADVHVVGKEIARFHAIYWPAFLMSAGIALPRRVYSHGWWTVEGEKMSKSLGNGIDPRILVKQYGVDPLRYFMLREVPFGNDGDFSRRALISRMNVELANDLGNLAQRSLSLVAKNCDGRLPSRGDATEDDVTMRAAAEALPALLRERLDRQAFGDALEEVWKVVRAANGYIDRQAPWALRKTDFTRMGSVLRVLVDVLRLVATVLQPFMPDTMARMLDQLAVAHDARDFDRLAHPLADGTILPPPSGLFPRYVEDAPKMLIDSHCHLDYYSDDEIAAVLARAAAEDVGELVTIGTRLSQSLEIREKIAERHENVWCTVGIHPHNAGEFSPPSPEAIAAMTVSPKVIGIGESGLDYFYDKAPWDAQAESFRAHVRAAQITGLPLVIHARDADAEIARILREEREEGGPFLFLLHCFSSGWGLAEAALDMGGYISFSGILTFPKSQEIRDIAQKIPAERLLVETDAPYLAPVPHRGKRNEPAWVARTAERLAEVRGMTLADLGMLTTRNFRTLFGKAVPA